MPWVSSCGSRSWCRAGLSSKKWSTRIPAYGSASVSPAQGVVARDVEQSRCAFTAAMSGDWLICRFPAGRSISSFGRGAFIAMRCCALAASSQSASTMGRCCRGLGAHPDSIKLSTISGLLWTAGLPHALRRLMLPASNDTLLRVIRRQGRPPFIPPAVIEIDDGAWRRNQRYGTLICDLERRQTIALLPDREPATAQAWFTAQPQITIVARDRGGGYALAAARALPAAIQVADRCWGGRPPNGIAVPS